MVVFALQQLIAFTDCLQRHAKVFIAQGENAMEPADRDDMRSKRQDAHIGRRSEPAGPTTLMIVTFWLVAGFACCTKVAAQQAPTPPAQLPEQVTQLEQSPVPVESPHVLKKQHCAYLDESIQWIDARARQPLSGGKQDWLAARRRELRDEQFRIRC